MTDAWRCTWWQGWGSARRAPTAHRPCRWHNNEANCVCIHPELYDAHEPAVAFNVPARHDAMEAS